MIKILNPSLIRQAILKNVLFANRFEKLNGDNYLNFTSVIDEKISNHLDENCVIELDNNYFDIAHFVKKQNEDGSLTVEVESEHISYRLNEPNYDKEWFTEIGTPTFILGKILEGTGFTVGTVQFSTAITYSAQERKTRRQLLMEFAHLLGGELLFEKFKVSLLQHRGNDQPKIYTTGKNIKILSKTVDKRERDSDGNYLVSYECSPIVLPGDNVNVGDQVILVHKQLDLRENLRVVSYSYNPYDPIEREIELNNFVSGLEDMIYRIETETLTKEKIYNGCRIGPDEGFVVERSDGKAKTIMNATEGISIYGDTGNGLERNFFVDINGRLKAKGLDIDGDGTFKGNITGASGDFYGTVKANNIIAGTINTDLIRLESGDGSLIIEADSIMMQNADGSLITIDPSEGLRVMHSPGNYSIYNADGMNRYINGQTTPYKFLSATGIITKWLGGKDDPDDVPIQRIILTGQAWRENMETLDVSIFMQKQEGYSGAYTEYRTGGVTIDILERRRTNTGVEILFQAYASWKVRSGEFIWSTNHVGIDVAYMVVG